MGNRARIMSMDVLPIAVCMFLCMSYLTPGYAQAQRTCQECIVILYETNFVRLTQGIVRNLLHWTNLAHSRDIESIEILSELNMAIITLFNPRGKLSIVFVFLYL